MKTKRKLLAISIVGRILAIVIEVLASMGIFAALIAPFVMENLHQPLSPGNKLLLNLFVIIFLVLMVLANDMYASSSVKKLEHEREASKARNIARRLQESSSKKLRGLFGGRNK